jgi:hypothetical protein
MTRATPILAVLLLASLLGNAMLAVRLSKRPEPEAATARKTIVDRAVLPDESPASLKESLAAERKKNEELRARIERLETDKKVLAQDAPSPGAADKLAAFRTKLRKLMKVMKDPAAKAGAVDPDSVVELTDTMMEFFKISALRTKEPKAYADYLQAFYEVGLEGEGTALSAEQSSTLSKLPGDERRADAHPAGARRRAAAEGESWESGAASRIKSVLSEAQQQMLAKESMNALAVGNMLSMSYVTKQGGADQIAQQWSVAPHQLDPAQMPQGQARRPVVHRRDDPARPGEQDQGLSVRQGRQPGVHDYRSARSASSWPR